MVRVLPPETMQAVVEQTPLGRLGTPEEIAAVIRFLLSEESSFMTGHTLGGQRRPYHAAMMKQRGSFQPG